jgi:hypothetical protein
VSCGFLAEIREVDAELAGKLQDALMEMAEGSWLKAR